MDITVFAPITIIPFFAMGIGFALLYKNQRSKNIFLGIMLFYLVLNLIHFTFFRNSEEERIAWVIAVNFEAVLMFIVAVAMRINLTEKSKKKCSKHP